MCWRSVNARPSGAMRLTMPPGFPAVANVSATSISEWVAYPFVCARSIHERSRATVYPACCERASVDDTFIQSRYATSVRSTSVRPFSSAITGSDATVLEGKLSSTLRRCAAW